MYNYIAMYNKYRHNSRGANSGLEQAHRWVYLSRLINIGTILYSTYLPLVQQIRVRGIL